MVGELLLAVRDYTDQTRWRWVLTDAAGSRLAEHEVHLNTTDWQFEAFADLPFYLRWHATPDRRAMDEVRIVGEVGEWIGSHVLGAIGPALLRRRPAVVRVVVPTGAEALLLRPLELAHVARRSLAVQDVTLVMSAGTGGASSPVRERLRVLGLFSLPEGRRALNLRRERRELVRLFECISATGKAADVRVLQYGVTRDALRDVLAEGEGWDIVHISGHGRPGELLLEEADGSLDLVDGSGLADLLDIGCERIKLVTVSACWSAAEEQRRLLGLPTPDEDDARADVDPIAGAGTASGTLASLLASRLGCAVLAMRYPVGDSFAMALAGRVYELLVAKGQPLARAVGMTLRELGSCTAARSGTSVGPGAGTSAGRAFPALSVAAPALFGDVAADLRLAAPARWGPLGYDAGPLKMTGFPPQAARFVGRTGVMARASAALTAHSSVPGVLLHGVPGGGKTACAVELAYGHEHAFDRLVWYKAPDEGMAIDGALTDFALTLELYLPGFQMAHELVSSERLNAFLPRLTELMERRRVLIVIDNAESLLAEDSAWRDDRWGQVLAALTAHTGPGRVVLTSRRQPATGLASLRPEPVDALSADEALLLIRELPHLQALSHGKVIGLAPVASRQLARRAIELAQGHPKLLELAEGQAAHPDQLAALLEAADQAWKKQGGMPDGFFSDGASTASGDDYLKVLCAWAKSVTGTLPPVERDLFWFLCCLGEADRERRVLDDMWAGLWTRLGRTGQGPDVDQALTLIAARGLIAIRADPGSSFDWYRIHPGVAAAGRDDAGQPFRESVDAEAAAYWTSVHQRASAEAEDHGVDTGLLVRAGLAAVPYLARLQEWGAAAALLRDAFGRDPSRAHAAAALPAIQLIARHDPRQTSALARVMEVIAPAAAEVQLRSDLDTALAKGDYRAASVVASARTRLYRVAGRPDEALALTEQMEDYTERAGLGPWTRLSDEAVRLQLLAEKGHADTVLKQAHRLRDNMTQLPVTSDSDEAVTPWDARETLLDVGRLAARRLGRWDDTLAWNAEILESLDNRRAPVADIALARFHDHAPLLRLGRTREALRVLLDGRQVFEDARDTKKLGMVLSGLADAEDDLGHGDAAIQLERDALRYSYLAGSLADIAVSYNNLGIYLRNHARQGAPALGCHLAAALIRVLTDSWATRTSTSRLANSMLGATADLRELGISAVPPADIAELCRLVCDIPGADLPGLIARLSPNPETAEQALRDLVSQARALARRS